MRPVVTVTAALCIFSLGCSSGTRTPPASAPQPAAAGALSIQVNPNPVVAQLVSGDTYDFPLEVVVREVGGAGVTINRIVLEVVALGALPIYNQTVDAAEIQRRGFKNTVAAGGELRYHFNPRKEVPDNRLFGSVSADLTVFGTDTAGSATKARTSVTIRR